ncbi:hypothetical protein OAJ60_04135 [Planctomycetaceae bacterium]|nr:hypothetical protein [Planctomycetaceae bacterium]
MNWNSVFVVSNQISIETTDAREVSRRGFRLSSKAGLEIFSVNRLGSQVPVDLQDQFDCKTGNAESVLAESEDPICLAKTGKWSEPVGAIPVLDNRVANLISPKRYLGFRGFATVDIETENSLVRFQVDEFDEVVSGLSALGSGHHSQWGDAFSHLEIKDGAIGGPLEPKWGQCLLDRRFQAKTFPLLDGLCGLADLCGELRVPFADPQEGLDLERRIGT